MSNSKRQQAEKYKMKRVPGRTFFVLQSYFSDINIIKPFFLCLVFICHIFFYPSTVKLLLSFYFNASFIAGTWLGLGFFVSCFRCCFFIHFDNSASYTWVLKLFTFNFIVALAGLLSPTLLFVSTCLFGCLWACSFTAPFSLSFQLRYYILLYHFISSVAGSSNTYPGLIKGYLQSILYTSSHLTLYTFISTNLTIPLLLATFHPNLKF